VVIQEVLSVLWDTLSSTVLQEPTEAALKKTADDWKIWNMRHCVGGIDGKHVRVVVPTKSGSMYFNYKGYFNI
jgi:predicted Rdx family selenoprotein